MCVRPRVYGRTKKNKLVGCDGYVRISLLKKKMIGGAHIRGQLAIIITLIGAAILR